MPSAVNRLHAAGVPPIVPCLLVSIPQDERAMVVLENVRKEWRLFCVLECIGMSFVLALLAVKVTDNGPAISRDDPNDCVNHWDEGCTIYDWDLILHQLVVTITVCALVLSQTIWPWVVTVTLGVLWLALGFGINGVFGEKAVHAGWVYAVFAVVLAVYFRCTASTSSVDQVPQSPAAPTTSSVDQVPQTPAASTTSSVEQAPQSPAASTTSSVQQCIRHVVVPGLACCALRVLVWLVEPQVEPGHPVKWGTIVADLVRTGLNLGLSGFLVQRLLSALGGDQRSIHSGSEHAVATKRGCCWYLRQTPTTDDNGEFGICESRKK